MLELGDRLEPVDLLGLDPELVGDGIGQNREPLLLELEPLDERLRLVLGLLLIERHDQVLLQQLGAGLGPAARIGRLLPHLRYQGSLIETVTLEAGLELNQRGLGVGVLAVGVQGLNLDVGVGQLHQDRPRFHDGAGQVEDLFDPARRDGGDPPDVFGHERPGAADFAEHLSLDDRVEVDGSPLHRRNRRPEPGERYRHHDQAHDDRAADEVPLHALGLVAYDVHEIAPAY